MALKEQLSVTFPKISYVFVGRSVGYLAGSMVGGVMFEWFHPSMLMALALLAAGIGLIAAPFCGTLWILAAVISMVGLAMGALDTGKNMQVFLLFIHMKETYGKFLNIVITKLQGTRCMTLF